MAEAQGNQNANAEKTFTQAEVDAIVGERLGREKAKYADYDDLKNKAAEYDKQQEASKSELQKAQEKSARLQAKIDSMEKHAKLVDMRAKVSKDVGVPAELLTGEDEETCKEQAEAIMKFAKGSRYPGVKEEKHESKRTGTSANSETDGDYRELAGQIFGRKE